MRTRTTECRLCKYASETYVQGLRHHAALYFDLEMASSICSDKRNTVELSKDEIERLLDRRYIDETHVQHVNENEPGILAHIPERLRELLQELPPTILIDGGHRASKALKREVKYQAFPLSEEETLQVIRRSNKELLATIGFE